jgi:mRNA interferase RelE/StbE
MYKIEFRGKSVQKVYEKLPENVRRHCFEKLTHLAESPYAPHHDVKKLQGSDNCYRLRVGDWRIIYGIDNQVLVIEIIKIGHRKEVYK